MNAKISVLVLAAVAMGWAGMDAAWAQRGGGRGGGGMSRGSMGGGSMRSAPSVSRPTTSRPSSFSHSTPRPAPRSDFQRPAGSDFDRPAHTEFSRSDLPAASRDLPGNARSAYSSGADRPSYGAALNRTQPASYGSVSRPAAAAGVVAAATVGGAALAANPNLRARESGVRGASGGNLPGGGDYRVGTGPGGGQAGAISGPRGDFVAIRGPGGHTAAGARDADGDRAAFRGPRGNAVVDDVPDGCDSYYWGGHSYWHSDYYWYAPYWHDEAWYYEYRYPPVGYWYPELPPGYETNVVDDETYYSADSMYYQEGSQDGRDGYVVVPPPATNSAGEALAVLLRTCDFLGSVTSFTAEIDLDMDRYLQAGDKVPVAAQCVVRVRQPDRFAVDCKGSADDRRVVYDGQRVVLQDRLEPKYSVTGTLPRLEDAIPDVKAKQNVAVPLGDLLQRDAFDALSTAIQTAEYVGIRKIDGIDTHHLAFSQENADWQLWVQTGDRPLPVKAVIQYKHEARSPRFAWYVRKWDLESPLADDAFVIDPVAAASPSAADNPPE